MKRTAEQALQDELEESALAIARLEAEQDRLTKLRAAAEFAVTVIEAKILAAIERNRRADAALDALRPSTIPSELVAPEGIADPEEPDAPEALVPDGDPAAILAGEPERPLERERPEIPPSNEYPARSRRKVGSGGA